MRRVEFRDTTGIVLAGGSSRRLGRDKALEAFGRENLVQRAVGRLPDLGEVVVVTSRLMLPRLQSLHLPVRLVSDVHAGVGPLGGIHAGLRACATEYALVVACDMPFLNTALLRHMVCLRTGFDVVVPLVNGLPEPLHAVYSRGCIPAIERQLAEGRASVHILLGLVRVRYLGQEEVDRFDPEHLSFFNVNSMADMRRARELAERLPGRQGDEREDD